MKNHSPRNQNSEDDSFASSIFCTRWEIPSCSVNQVALPFPNCGDDEAAEIVYVVVPNLKRDLVAPLIVSVGVALFLQFYPFFARFSGSASFATK